MTRAYAGIGSRSTPHDILKLMKEFGRRAALSGYVLRSGAAKGADSAFEEGCDLANGEKQIFLPWKGYNNSTSTYYEDSLPQAYELAKMIHPAWNQLTAAARKLVARNMHQINGPQFYEPVEFVVCWTKDGCESHTTYGRATGGTGTAICAASFHAVPVYNFYHEHRILEAFDHL